MDKKQEQEKVFFRTSKASLFLSISTQNSNLIALEKNFQTVSKVLTKDLPEIKLTKAHPEANQVTSRLNYYLTATISISYHFSILGAEPRNVNHGNGGSRGGGGGQRKGQEKGNL